MPDPKPRLPPVTLRALLTGLPPLPLKEGPLPPAPFMGPREAFVGPVPSAGSPLAALAKASSIGPPVVGDRYATPTWPEIQASAQPLLSLLEVFMGPRRAPEVAAQDPYGAQAWLKGAGPMPAVLGTTEPVVGGAKAATMALGEVVREGAQGGPVVGRVLRGGFYSRVDEAVGKLPAKGAHPNKVAGILKNNASAEELAYRQVPEFLAAQGNKTVTPEALQAHLAAHPAPFPEVKTLGGPASVAPMPEGYRIERLAPGNRPGAQNNYTLIGPDGSGRAFYATDAADAQVMANDMLGLTTKAPPKYGQYQVPGGEQYRETLLTLPPAPRPGQAVAEARVQALQTELQQLYQDAEGLSRRGSQGLDPVWARITDLQTEHRALMQQMSQDPPNLYRSSHYPDAPNLVVHTRATERTLPTGARGRFVEEVQSDWHQQGKEKGYGPPTFGTAAEQEATHVRYEAARDAVNRGTPGSPEWPAIVQEHRDAEAQMRQMVPGWGRSTEATIPDAPFKEAWPDLGVKQQLIEAAHDPYAEWLGFTSGDTQAARYDLSKQISKLDYDPGERRLRAFDRTDPSRTVIDQTVDLDDLAEYIGKEPAAALRAQVARHEQGRAWERSQWHVAPDADDPQFFNIYDSNGELYHNRAGNPQRYRRAEDAERQIDDLLDYETERERPSLTGLDLQVGGEGMRYFYDQLLPKRVEKILAPLGGGPVERVPLNADKTAKLGAQNEFYYESGAISEAEYLKRKAEMEQPIAAWMARLTPELKQKIRDQGLPLLTLLGATSLGALVRGGEAPGGHAR